MTNTQLVSGPICLPCEEGDHGQDWVLIDHKCACPCHGRKRMLVPNSEMLRAQPHLRADCGRDYVAFVTDSAQAILLADKLALSYVDLDGIFYGRTATRWNSVQ